MTLAGTAPIGVATAPIADLLDIIGTGKVVAIKTTPFRLGPCAPGNLAGFFGTVLLVVGRMRMWQEPPVAVRALAFSSRHHRPLSGRE